MDGEGLAVINETPALDVALIVDDEARFANFVSRCAIQLDALAVVGNDIQASLRNEPVVSSPYSLSMMTMQLRPRSLAAYSASSAS